jgi:hypothetical protein
MSNICDSIDRMASTALSSLTSLPTECENKSNDELDNTPSNAILIHCEFAILRSSTILELHFEVHYKYTIATEITIQSILFLAVSQ